MNAYGTLLKKLIRFTNIKLTNLAEIVGYDTSYISKWCNKDKLPASKAASHVNKCLAGVFASEIFAQEETALFARDFHIQEPADESELSAAIHHMLKDAYKSAYDHTTDTTRASDSSQHNILLWEKDIKAFFRIRLPELIRQMENECHILCTMDICGFLPELSFENIIAREPDLHIHIKMGMNLNRRDARTEYIRQIYYMLNHYSYINFDFYDNSQMDLMNLLVIKDCIAVQCSLDKDYHINMISVINDLNQVNAIYEKVSVQFTLNKLLIHSTDSDELFYNGYRTEFYAHNNFQILLTRGFEFLLPSEINPRLIRAAIEQGFDSNMTQLIAHLGMTWEEIFEKGCIDFYLLKTSLLRYLTDGIIYFADVVYHMSASERKSHLEHVLEVVQKNPNIRFFIIDDECIPHADDLIHISVFNNKSKLFLKNTNRYSTPYGPQFYTIQNDLLIQDICSYFDSIQDKPFCHTYHSEDVLHFYDRYGTLIHRMLSFGEQ